MLELGKATLASCTSNVQQHAAALQLWLDSEQTNVPEPEDAHDFLGMKYPPYIDRDTPARVYCYRPDLYQAHARCLFECAMQLDQTRLIVQGCL